MIKKGSKYLTNILIVIVLFLALFMYILKVDGIDTIVDVARNVNLFWALASIAFIVIYWILEALVLHILCKKRYSDNKFFRSFKITMIGQFFNNITPFSSGGQPVQAVMLTKDKKSFSDSVSILLIKFIVFQAVHVLYTLFILIFKYSYFKSIVPNFAFLSIIGFTVNVSVIIALILIGINEKFVVNVANWVYNLLGKIKLLKNANEKLEKVKGSIDSFHKKFKIISTDLKTVIVITITTIIQLTAFFMIAYTVYRSLGFNAKQLFNIISAQAFLTMIMSFVPIPGAGGVAEGGFYLIFKHFFTDKTINIAVLLWRFYTFYLPIIIGALFMISFKNKDDKKMLEQEIESVEV